jgi:hypothetical protein
MLKLYLQVAKKAPKAPKGRLFPKNPREKPGKKKFPQKALAFGVLAP